MTWVEMVHPDLDAPPALVTLEAFEAVHQEKGFVLVEAPAQTEPLLEEE